VFVKAAAINPPFRVEGRHPPWRHSVTCIAALRKVRGDSPVRHRVSTNSSEIRVSMIRNEHRSTIVGPSLRAIRHVKMLGVDVVRGDIVTLDVHAVFESVARLSTRTVLEHIDVFEVGAVPESIANGNSLLRPKLLRYRCVAEAHIATGRGVVNPDVVRDVDVGTVESIVAIDVDDDVVLPPIATTLDGGAARDAGRKRNNVSGHKATRRPVKWLIDGILPYAVDHLGIVDGNVVALGLTGSIMIGCCMPASLLAAGLDAVVTTCCGVNFRLPAACAWARSFCTAARASPCCVKKMSLSSSVQANLSPIIWRACGTATVDAVQE
jgi:hypothetical protein